MYFLFAPALITLVVALFLNLGVLNMRKQQ